MKQINFQCTQEQYLKIKENAKLKGVSMSKHCRDRALKEELTLNETLNFLVMFIIQLLDERAGNITSIRKTVKLKDLVKPLNMKMETIMAETGMDKKQRDLFEKNWQNKMSEYGKISEELDSMLERFYVEA